MGLLNKLNRGKDKSDAYGKSNARVNVYTTL